MTALSPSNPLPTASALLVPPGVGGRATLALAGKGDFGAAFSAIALPAARQDDAGAGALLPDGEGADAMPAMVGADDVALAEPPAMAPVATPTLAMPALGGELPAPVAPTPPTGKGVDRLAIALRAPVRIVADRTAGTVDEPTTAGDETTVPVSEPTPVQQSAPLATTAMPQSALLAPMLPVPGPGLPAASVLKADAAPTPIAAPRRKAAVIGAERAPTPPVPAVVAPVTAPRTAVATSGFAATPTAPLRADAAVPPPARALEAPVEGSALRTAALPGGIASALPRPNAEATPSAPTRSAPTPASAPVAAPARLAVDGVAAITVRVAASDRPAAAAADRARPARFEPADPTAMTAIAPVAVAPDAADAPPLDLGDRRWPAAMVDRIERLRDTADAADTRIRVVPDALGPVGIALRRVGEAFDVGFTAAHETTRALLAEARPAMVAIAADRGVTIAAVSVEPAAAVPPAAAPAALADQPRAVPASTPSQATPQQQASSDRPPAHSAPQPQPQPQPRRAAAAPLPAVDDDARTATRLA